MLVFLVNGPILLRNDLDILRKIPKKTRDTNGKDSFLAPSRAPDPLYIAIKVRVCVFGGPAPLPLLS